MPQTACPRPSPDAFFPSAGTEVRNLTYRPKATIFRQGDAADAVFYIRKGAVQLSIISDEGKEGIIEMLGAGEFFGDQCLAGQKFYTASATAISESVIDRIETAAMVRMLHEQPALSELFTTFLLVRKMRMEAALIDQLLNSSERRLARVLLQLADFSGPGEMGTILPGINQETLAARIGTTRARTNHFMNKFRKLGLIEYGRPRRQGLKVHRSLVDIIGSDSDDNEIRIRSAPMAGHDKRAPHAEFGQAFTSQPRRSLPTLPLPRDAERMFPQPGVKS